MGDSKTCRLDLLVGDMRAFKSRFQVSGFKQWVYGVFKNIALRGIVEARFKARCFVDFIWILKSSIHIIKKPFCI